VPWIVTGVGGALTVAGAVMLGVGIGDVSSVASSCPSHQCPKGDQSLIDKGNAGLKLEDAGIVVGSIGLAAVVAGSIWAIVNSSAPASTTTTGTFVSPVVAPGYAGLTLRSSL
jgi:hypothetical protein